MAPVSLGRANGCHYFPHWVTGLWLSAGLLALLLVGGCGRGVSVVEGAARRPDARGTISGVIRGPQGTSPVIGRDVQVVNTETGARHSARTGEHGGFTIELPAGRYRIELPLRDGETLLKRPGIVDLDTGALDSHVELVLATVRVARPRGPAYRLDNGLGSPIT
jgi:hypothetical protein